MADDSRIRVPAQLTTAGLWLMAVVYLAKAAATPVLDSGSFSPALTMLFVVLALGWLFTVVSFLTWLYLARDTLDRRGERYLRWSKGWSIGGWFIPVANLVIPCLVVGEVYGHSVPSAFRAGKTSGIVVGWWVALVLSVFRFTITEVDTTTHTTVVHLASFWNAVNGIAGVVAALLAIRIVGRVTSGLAQWRPQTPAGA
jgi:hypothetical protein